VRASDFLARVAAHDLCVTVWIPGCPSRTCPRDACHERRFPMKQRLRALAPWLAILAVIVASHICVNRGAVDDLAVMYANSWLETCRPDDPLPQLLDQHLAKHGPSLSSVRQKRYSLRLDLLGDNYPLLSILLRLAALAGASGLRAVIGALLIEHVFVVVLVLALMRRQPWLMLALMVSALAALTLWPLDAGSVLAFQRAQMTWVCPMPRGAAVLAWFGSLVALLFMSGKRRFVVAAAFAVLAVACHRSMAALCFASTLPPLGLWWALRERIISRSTPRRLVISFLGILIIVAGAKLALLLHYHSPTLSPLFSSSVGAVVSPVRPILTLVFWAAWTLGALLTWLRARASTSLAPVLLGGGDALAALLFVTGAVALGANTVQADHTLWYGPLFYVSEACTRLGSVAHLLFFALAALSFSVLRPGLLRPSALAVAALAIVLSMLEVALFDQPMLPTTAPPLAGLLRRGAKAYSHETDYFLSIALEVEARGCGKP
jgi:hypothetical protein